MILRLSPVGGKPLKGYCLKIGDCPDFPNPLCRQERRCKALCAIGCPNIYGAVLVGRKIIGALNDGYPFAHTQSRSPRLRWEGQPSLQKPGTVGSFTAPAQVREGIGCRRKSCR